MSGLPASAKSYASAAEPTRSDASPVRIANADVGRCFPIGWIVRGRVRPEPSGVARPAVESRIPSARGTDRIFFAARRFAVFATALSICACMLLRRRAIVRRAFPAPRPCAPNLAYMRQDPFAILPFPNPHQSLKRRPE